MVHLDPFLLTLLIGSVLPVLVGIVTKLQASDTIKSTVNVALAAVTAVLVQVQSMGGNFDWKASVALFASTFVASGATYQHFWVPIGKTDVPPLATATANFGIGGPSGSVQNEDQRTVPPRYDDPLAVPTGP